MWRNRYEIDHRLFQIRKKWLELGPEVLLKSLVYLWQFNTAVANSKINVTFRLQLANTFRQINVFTTICNWKQALHPIQPFKPVILLKRGSLFSLPIWKVAKIMLVYV
jgi:hypothetical protein